jgi:hypothetical protein
MRASILADSDDGGVEGCANRRAGVNPTAQARPVNSIVLNTLGDPRESRLGEMAGAK